VTEDAAVPPIQGARHDPVVIVDVGERVTSVGTPPEICCDTRAEGYDGWFQRAAHVRLRVHHRAGRETAIDGQNLVGDYNPRKSVELR
jgi:hypothetical protein